MERIIVILFILVFSTTTIIGQGITFYEDDWSVATLKAKEENKCLFVEVFGDWCSACRNMEKNVFTVPEVGALYNSSFVNVRLNGDSPQNKTRIDQWNITAYPSLLIANSDGIEIARITGFTNGIDLIHFGTDAIQYSKEIAGLGQEPTIKFLKSFLLNYTHISEANKNPYLELYFRNQNIAALAHSEDLKILNSAIVRASPGMIDYLFIFYSKPENGLQHPRELKQLDARLQALAQASNQVDSILIFHDFRLKLSAVYNEDYPFSAGDIDQQKEDDLLDFFKIEKKKESYHQLSVKIMEERFMHLTPRQINRKDGYLNQELTPNNPRIMGHEITDYINEVCITYYRFYGEKENLNKALYWVSKGIEIITSARGYMIAAGLCNKLEKHSQARIYLGMAKQQKNYVEEAYLFEDLISAYAIK